MKSYVKNVAQSLRFPSDTETLEDFFLFAGSSPAREGFSWTARVDRWREHGVVTVNIRGTKVIKGYNVMPIFPQLWHRALKEDSPTKEPIKEETPIMLESVKTTANTIVDQNKAAGILAAELTVGRTANEFLMAKVVKTLPWWKRCFVKENSWLGKLAVAQVANALIQQTSDNKRLQRIGDAMLKESVIEATVYSDQITGLIMGLEEAVGLPFLDKIMSEK